MVRLHALTSGREPAVAEGLGPSLEDDIVSLVADGRANATTALAVIQSAILTLEHFHLDEIGTRHRGAPISFSLEVKTCESYAFLPTLRSAFNIPASSIIWASSTEKGSMQYRMTRRWRRICDAELTLLVARILVTSPKRCRKPCFALVIATDEAPARLWA
eukprot:1328339-Amorphochlora_amoeboformis.AAC.1